MLDLLALRDRALALVVGQALLPRLDIRMQHRIEHVQLCGVFDDHDPFQRVELRQTGTHQRRLARTGRPGEHDPDLRRTHARPKKLGNDVGQHLQPDQISQSHLAQRVAPQRERDMLRNVAGSSQTQTVSETHHQQRYLTVELTFRASCGAGQM